MKKIGLFLSIFLALQVSGLAQSVIPFVGGYTQEKIIQTPKGERPSPATYLSQKYISKHLRQFKKGASFLTSKDILDKYGREKLGRADGQFVMSKKEMDKLLKKAKGNVVYVETELGIPEGMWKNKTIVRIDIPAPQLLHLRIPDGNEAGANELWLPGGRLPKGYRECVVNQISQGQYTETSIDIH